MVRQITVHPSNVFPLNRKTFVEHVPVSIVDGRFSSIVFCFDSQHSGRCWRPRPHRFKNMSFDKLEAIFGLWHATGLFWWHVVYPFDELEIQRRITANQMGSFHSLRQVSPVPPLPVVLWLLYQYAFLSDQRIRLLTLSWAKTGTCRSGTPTGNPAVTPGVMQRFEC